ncbi:MAG TPA: PilZ domain-containing protein [Spirochaetia bacterium]|nr:PilZ domain-containing protein [Spirochaetia bacterium]
MVILVVLLALAFLAVLAVILLRRAGGGRFPWLQFYMKGRESGFLFHEINLLRRVSTDNKIENPTALFWSMKQLDKALKGTIIKYRARSQEQDPEYNLLLSKLFELRKRVEFDQPKYKMGIKSSRKLMPKQSLRITLPGLGPFYSTVVENLTRYMAVSRPQGPKLPDGFSWKNQKIGVYLWRAEDAGYFFQTKVLEDFIERKYPIVHIAHSDNLVRTQKRNSLRVETDMSAELFPLKSIDNASESPEQSRGLRCRLADLSEGGAAILIGGKARVGLPIKLQFTLGDTPVTMSGVVKGITFDEKKNRSLLHMQAAAPATPTRNRILTYVYNLFGERETIVAGRKPEAARESPSGGITLKAGPASPSGGPGPSAAGPSAIPPRPTAGRP